jgi:hypothetical protein
MIAKRTKLIGFAPLTPIIFVLIAGILEKGARTIKINKNALLSEIINKIKKGSKDNV